MLLPPIQAPACQVSSLAEKRKATPPITYSTVNIFYIYTKLFLCSFILPAKTAFNLYSNVFSFSAW